MYPDDTVRITTSLCYISTPLSFSMYALTLLYAENYTLSTNCRSYQAREKWNLGKIVMQHKLGPCPICDISIAIVISSEHRAESLAATQFAIDELKLTVPIWKKEHYDSEAPVWKANAKQRSDAADGTITASIAGLETVEKACTSTPNC